MARVAVTIGYDEPRPGAPRQIGDDAIAEAVRLTLVYRASGAQSLGHPNGIRGATEGLAYQGPVAALRFLDDVPHRPA